MDGHRAPRPAGPASREDTGHCRKRSHSLSGGAPVIAGLGGVLLFLAAGRGLVELLPAFRERPLPARLAWSYLLGVAVVAGSVYVLGVAFDIRIRRGVVLAPATVLVAAGLLARALRRGTPHAVLIRPPRAGVVVAGASFGISALISTGLFAAALTQPNVGFDGEMSWCAAARWVRADRSVTPRALRDPRTFVSHPRYPLLLPLAQVVVQETFDAGDDRRVIKPLYAAFFPALLLVLFDVARRHAGTCAAALAAAALAAVPVFASDFGGADGAYSDVPLGAFLGSGFLLLLGRTRRSEAIAAALLLGAAVLTKNEGLPFALAALAAAGFLALFLRRKERGPRLALLAVAAAGVLAAGVVLSMWKAPIPQRDDEDYLGRLGKVSLAAEAGARLPLVPAAVVLEMTDRADLAGFSLAGAVILAAGAGGLRRRIVPPILLCLYFCFGAYVLALLLTTWPGVLQVHATWNRLMIQLTVPLGVLLSLSLRAAWRARFAAFGTASSPAVMAAAPLERVKSSRLSPRGPLVFLGFAVLPVVATWVWAAHLRELAHSPQTLPSASVPTPMGSPWREDPSLTGSVDEPEEGSLVHGQLEVRGWARIPGEDLHVTVTIDGKRRSSLAGARVPRPDVEAAVPSLGDCRAAGYEAAYPFEAGDAGPHEIQVIFRTHDGRERRYPARRFIWNP